MPNKTKHLHIYQKVNLASPIYDKKLQKMVHRKHFVFKCTKLDCSHYLAPALVRDKMAECPFCGEPYILTKKQMLRTNPHCESCTKGQAKEELSTAIDLLKELNLDS